MLLISDPEVRRFFPCAIVSRSWNAPLLRPKVSITVHHLRRFKCCRIETYTRRQQQEITQARSGCVEISAGFLAIEIERFEHRRIAHRKKNRVVRWRAIQMPMIVPERHDKRVALLPIEAALADPGRAVPAEHMVNDRARVPVLFSFTPGDQ